MGAKIHIKVTSDDPIGTAILDYQQGNDPQPIIIETNITEADEMHPSHFFREFVDMPKIEQAALELCYGHVLDVGCGAGSHSLYLRDVKNLEVKPIDVSEAAITACRLRGLEAVREDIFDSTGKFDTILLLMNGTGIAGSLQNLPGMLKKLLTLISDGGQILIDSSDIIYMFDEDDDGGVWIPSDEEYYGQLRFSVSYKTLHSVFDWLYVSFPVLSEYAETAGLRCELVSEGEHFDYLARLTKL